MNHEKHFKANPMVAHPQEVVFSVNINVTIFLYSVDLGPLGPSQLNDDIVGNWFECVMFIVYSCKL